MAGKIGGAGSEKIAGGAQIDPVSVAQDGGAGTDAIADYSGAPDAKRTVRAKSLDMKGLGLAAALNARLDAKLGGATATAPKPTVEAAGPRGPKGPDPRPHAGAAAAKEVEKLIGAYEPVLATNEALSQFRKLFILDREGVRLAQGVSEGDVNTFRVFLHKIREDGQMSSFRGALNTAGTEASLDQKPIGFGAVPDDIFNILIREYGSKADKLAWDRA